MRKVLVANAAELTGGAEANPALPPPVQPPANPNPPRDARRATRRTITSDGMAVAPASAPQQVKDIIAAGNKIAKLPYRYGGGHNESLAGHGLRLLGVGLLRAARRQPASTRRCPRATSSRGARAARARG